MSVTRKQLSYEDLTRVIAGLEDWWKTIHEQGPSRGIHTEIITTDETPSVSGNSVITCTFEVPGIGRVPVATVVAVACRGRIRSPLGGVSTCPELDLHFHTQVYMGDGSPAPDTTLVVDGSLGSTRVAAIGALFNEQMVHGPGGDALVRDEVVSRRDPFSLPSMAASEKKEMVN